MIVALIYFLLNLVLFILTIIFYVFRNKEKEKNIIGELRKYSIIMYLIVFLFGISIVYFCINLKIITGKSESFSNSFFFTFAVLMLILSLVFFKNSFHNPEKKYFIELYYPSLIKSKKGTINMGKIIYKDNIKHPFNLSLDDLAQHMFVCGSTGSGKSNFLQYILLNISKKHNNLPFLITEFKGEYAFLQKEMQDLLILKPGENFSINIFDPEGSDAEIHAERVFQIFNSGGFLDGVEYSPQMERCFIDILKEVCPNSEKRNWDDFFKIISNYTRKTTDQTIKKSLLAIENRIRRYSLGTLKDIFSKKTGLTVKQLFVHKILLDLSSIIRLGGEKEDALFFLNMILKYLWDKSLELGSKDYDGIKHITIIEDAQYFAPEEFVNKTKSTSYLEDIALLLRGTGECLISLATRPKISKEILANCGVLVSFKNHLQKDLMQELLNLEDQQKEYLSMLQKGQCIVRVNSLEKPFVIAVPLVPRSWVTNEEIKRNNQKILESKLSTVEKELVLKENPEDINKPKALCKFCGTEIALDSEFCDTCAVELKKDDKDFQELKEFIKTLT